MNPEAVNILRLGIYQLSFMDSVPDSAAVNESVRLAKQRKLGRLSGFVNAVLRGFIRDNKQIKLPKDEFQMLSVKYSCPLWLVKMLCDGCGRENAEDFLADSLEVPPVTVRLNTCKVRDCECLKGLGARETALPHCCSIGTGSVIDTDAFKRGLFHVQDISSQMCCAALDPKEGETVLDVCAAPGGKTFTLAELSNGKAQIHAYDIHENRVKLIKQGAQRLGLDCVCVGTRDASKGGEMPPADKILCDVPCSGLGVIRRKPEIKYKDPKEFERLPDIQYRILEASARYLKKGGELIYSTCTLSKKENDDVIDRFLREHTDFEGVSFLEALGEPFGGFKAVLLPKYFGGDGFFISKIRRKE